METPHNQNQLTRGVSELSFALGRQDRPYESHEYHQSYQCLSRRIHNGMPLELLLDFVVFHASSLQLRKVVDLPVFDV